MNEIPIHQLCDTELIKTTPKILILDTCCLLDIVRSPIRDNCLAFHAAHRLLIEWDKHNVTVLLPSLIANEWADNIAGVSEEVRKTVSHIATKADHVHDVCTLLGVKSPVLTTAASLEVDIELRRVAETLMNKAITLAVEQQCHLSGVQRVLSRTPPARQGKDSLKDCVIFEEVLAVGRKLQAIGYSERIVFASSNTAEFDNKPISDELRIVNIQYVTSLNWGVNEVVK